MSGCGPGLRKNRSPSRKSKFSSPKSHGYSTNPFTTKNHTSKHQPKKIGLDMMGSFLRAAAVWLSLIAQSAGTIPIALQQSVDANGSPLSGCLLYIFQVGTTATPQNAFTDFGLTGELREGVPGGRVRQDPRRRHGRSALEKVANGVWWPDRDRLEADLAAFESVTSTTIELGLRRAVGRAVTRADFRTIQS